MLNIINTYKLFIFLLIIKVKISLNQISLLNHNFVPKHEIMNDEEINHLLLKYSINKEQLPKILINDPIVLEIGAKVGDIIKITRKSQTSDESIFYRLVIESIS